MPDDSELFRAYCPVHEGPGVFPRWEPVRGFLKCEECGAREDDAEWPDAYDYQEWLRRSRQNDVVQEAQDGRHRS